MIVLQGELNAINEEQKYHEKLRNKYSSAAQNKANEERDLEKLHALLKHQNQQIRKITKDIHTLRLKIKPENQFLLNERVTAERTSPQIPTFPDYKLDAGDDSPRTQSTHSYSSGASGISKASTISEGTSKASNAL